MTNITPYSALIQLEETTSSRAVAESTMQKIGGTSNFLTLNAGPYLQFETDTVSVATGVGQIYYAFTDLTINNICMYVKTAGNNNSTTVDIKASSAIGSSFVSIFSTTPSINYLAGNYTYATASTGTAIPNTRNAIFVNTPTVITAGSQIRFDILAVQSGSPVGVGIVLQALPTN